MGFWEAVGVVLEDASEPLHVKELTKRMLERGLWHSDGKTPEAAVAARLYSDIKTKGPASQFIQAGKATFALNPTTVAPAVTVAPTVAPVALPAPVEEPIVIAPSAVGAEVAGSDPGIKKRLSFTDATEDVLRRYGNGRPMHYRDITDKVLVEGLVKTSGKTPAATVYAQVFQENARAEKRGKPTRFVRHGKGLIGLTEWLQPGIHTEIAKHNARAEVEMLKQLRELDPADFEQLVGELLRALGIGDVEVTAYHGDKGIDATGTYELAPGLTVSVAVQAKRQAQNVGRPAVQSLNGSLKPHQQGLIITTAGLASSARAEAARRDNLLAPLTKLFEQPVSPLDELDQFAESIAKRPTPEPKAPAPDEPWTDEEWVASQDDAWAPMYEASEELVRKRADLTRHWHRTAVERILKRDIYMREKPGRVVDARLWHAAQRSLARRNRLSAGSSDGGSPGLSV